MLLPAAARSAYLRNVAERGPRDNNPGTPRCHTKEFGHVPYRKCWLD